MDIRSAILAAVDLKSEAVTVPEWGGVTVNVAEMTGEDRYSLSAESYDEAGKFIEQGFQSRLLVRSLRDDAGNKIFTAADIPALEAKSDSVLERLYGIARRVSGLDKKAVDDAVKN